MQKQMRFVERFRSKATKATQVQSRLKQLQKVQTIELPRTTKKVRYSFPEPPRSGAEVISLIGVSKSYGDTAGIPTASTCRCRAATASRWSGRTARARPRC